MRKIYFYSALLLTLIVILLLATGSSLLTTPLDSENSIPLGTPITWVGMIALPLTVYWGVRELRKPSTQLNSTLSILLKIMIILGILWVPLSYLLAGNLSFTFSGKASFQGGETASRIFWVLSYGIAIGTVLILIVYRISLLFTKAETNNRYE